MSLADAEKKLVDVAMTALNHVDLRDFYRHTVEVCARVFDSQVCALFIKTNKIDGKDRVCLVAGKLPGDHPDVPVHGQFMIPQKVGNKPEDHTYLVGTIRSKKMFDGITGEIASTNKSKIFSATDRSTLGSSHRGKWDRYIYPKGGFTRMLGSPISEHSNANSVIGVIKVENKMIGEYRDNDRELLEYFGSKLSVSLRKLIDQGDELDPQPAEFEYRVPRNKKGTFVKQNTGEVTIRHGLTGVCHSDVFYFLHEKPAKKLDERLPLVLGHETTGEIYQVVGDQSYNSGEKISVGDRVVVIPLIACGTCKVCNNGYGENYCPSSRFMASNAPGSLRNFYSYHSHLLLRIDKPGVNEEFAVFTEPMSNGVQMLQELGFVPNGNRIELKVLPFNYRMFSNFYFPASSFSNVFDTMTSEEPDPRTVFLVNKTGSGGNNDLRRKINHQNLMVKGLGILGWQRNVYPRQPTRVKRIFEEPKILILGSGITAYLLALILIAVYKVSARNIVVTGRTDKKLQTFKQIDRDIHLVLVKNGDDPTYNCKRTTSQLTVNHGKFDVVFECVGGKALQTNVDLAMSCVKEKGVVALEGLGNSPLDLDFGVVIDKEIYLKGFYRSALSAYKLSLEYIVENEAVRNGLTNVIDAETVINGRTKFHDIYDERDLTNVFETVDRKEHFGRLLIRRLAASGEDN